MFYYVTDSPPPPSTGAVAALEYIFQGFLPSRLGGEHNNLKIFFTCCIFELFRIVGEMKVPKIVGKHICKMFANFFIRLLSF